MSRIPLVDDCTLVALPRHEDENGTLTVLEAFDAVPFTIRRTFTISNVPAGGARGRHANGVTREFVVCLAGAVHVRLDDGVHQRTVHLTSPETGLYVAPMIWVDLVDFAPGTVLLVLASTRWDEAQKAYFHSRDDWQRELEVLHAA